MYVYRFVALSLLLSVSPAAARDRALNRNMDMTAQAAQSRSPLSDRYPGRGPSTARIPLDSNMDVGVGLYTVNGHFVRERERNGREPILGTTGRDNKIAAVGLSLRF